MDGQDRHPQARIAIGRNPGEDAVGRKVDADEVDSLGVALGRAQQDVEGSGIWNADVADRASGKLAPREGEGAIGGGD